VGKWADAFKAHIRARDTADTGDTSLGGPEAFPGSVSSVMPTDERLGGRQAPYSGLVSSVSALSRPGRTRNAERRLSEPGTVSHAATSFPAAHQRPPSWVDPSALPSPGCFCSCCHGQRWWCEREMPKGWRCWQCHPPDHLMPEAVTEYAHDDAGRSSGPEPETSRCGQGEDGEAVPPRRCRRNNDAATCGGAKIPCADLTARGDHLGAKFEVAEADELELDAEDILHPLSHTIAPVQIGRGGEMATGAAMMQPFLDTVRTRPDWLVHDASRERMELASKAGALTMGLDAVETIQARDSTEKMLMHQLAAAHSLAMRMAAASGEDLAAYKNSGHRYPHRSIEACRSANTAARLMDAYQRGLMTLDRLRNGGRQMVTELETWKQDAIGGLGEPRETESVAVKRDRRRIKELERELHRKDKALAENHPPCVRPVAARIGSASMGALDEEHGSIRTEVQRARCRAIVAAREFAGGSGLTDGWDQCHNAGALAG
jgi:hypothetical protein